MNAAEAGQRSRAGLLPRTSSEPRRFNRRISSLRNVLGDRYVLGIGINENEDSRDEPKGRTTEGRMAQERTAHAIQSVQKRKGVRGWQR